MNQRMTILVADNFRSDPATTATLLREQGYNVLIALTLQEAQDIILKKQIDMLIVDFCKQEVKDEEEMKQDDGNKLISFARKFNANLPIIVTTKRVLIESKLTAFNAGCNDFLAKPFNELELVARVKAFFSFLHHEEDKVFVNGPLKIDYSAGNVYVNDKEIHFTSYEFRILEKLSKNINKTITHDDIIAYTWGDGGTDENGLRVFMANIRKKIFDASQNKNIIKTVVGVGYRMNKIS